MESIASTSRLEGIATRNKEKKKGRKVYYIYIFKYSTPKSVGVGNQAVDPASPNMTQLSLRTKPKSAGSVRLCLRDSEQNQKNPPESAHRRISAAGCGSMSCQLPPVSLCHMVFPADPHRHEIPSCCRHRIGGRLAAAWASAERNGGSGD